MSRPKPHVIVRHIDDERIETRVHQADSIWVVCYKEWPISISKGPEGNAYPGYKYIRSSWPHPGHAFNMADRLNELFQTQDFTVWQMKPYRQITEVKRPTPPPVIERTWTPTKYDAKDIVPKKGQPRPKML